MPSDPLSLWLKLWNMIYSLPLVYFLSKHRLQSFYFVHKKDVNIYFLVLFGQFSADFLIDPIIINIAHDVPFQMMPFT